MSWHEKEKQRYEAELRKQWNADGTDQDPIRSITMYHTPDGDLLAGRDPWIVSQSQALDDEWERHRDNQTFVQTLHDLLQRRTGRELDVDPKILWPIVRDLITAGPKPVQTADRPVSGETI